MKNNIKIYFEKNAETGEVTVSRDAKFGNDPEWHDTCMKESNQHIIKTWLTETLRYMYEQYLVKTDIGNVTISVNIDIEE